MIAGNRNLALGRPALQSSVSPWSKGGDAAIDASGANNGVRDGQMGFHTAYEDRPWWQVDLGHPHLLREVRIYNRASNYDRLNNFTILGSFDGADWFELRKKADSKPFGHHLPDYYAATFVASVFARFVRIQLEGRDYLHFSECEVIGHSIEGLSAQDEARLLNECGPAALALAPSDELDLGKTRKGDFVTVGQVDIFVDTDAYSANMVETLRDGTYESKERELVEGLVKPEDRVFEIGSAVGGVSMTAAKIVGAAAVMTFEANPRIAYDARRNFAHNGLPEIRARTGLLYNRAAYATAPAEADFYVSRDFWASRLDPGNWAGDIVEIVKIRTACLEDEIEAHGANVLICDIEGGEIDLLCGAKLDGIRLIIMEVHPHFVGQEPTNRMIAYLLSEGFGVEFYYSGRGIAVMTRAEPKVAETETGAAAA
jgi:FkbM family methyltransferase